MDAKEREMFAAFNRITAAEAEVGFDALPPADRAFLAIWWLETEVNNGSFDQWMFNSAGDHALVAVAGLRDIGATAIADVCMRYFALLPGGAPEPERFARQDQLDAARANLGEDAYEEACGALSNEFYALEGDELRDRLLALVRGR